MLLPSVVVLPGSLLVAFQHHVGQRSHGCMQVDRCTACLFERERKGASSISKGITRSIRRASSLLSNSMKASIITRSKGCRIYRSKGS